MCLIKNPIMYIHISLDKKFLCAYTLVVEPEWDPDKAQENKRDHGIDFADAVQVFDNPYLNREDPNAVGEQVFVALGLDGLGRLLVVVYTYRGDKIRLISARKATKKEGKEYAQRVRFQ
jgi:hypothetical protein